MPSKKKKRFLSLQEQEKAKLDFKENIVDDEETHFKDQMQMTKFQHQFPRVNRRENSDMKNMSKF